MTSCPSFPGFGFLLVLLTYRYVPYGDSLLALVLIVFLLSGAARVAFQVFQKLSNI